jgi:hypothetical protein
MPLTARPPASTSDHFGPLILDINDFCLESTRPRGRPRNRWQDEVKEGGRIVGEEEWQEKYITEENGRSS